MPVPNLQAQRRRRAERLRLIAKRQLVFDEEMVDSRWLQEQGYMRVRYWPEVCFIITEEGYAFLREHAVIPD